MPFLGSGEFQTPTFPDELVVAVRRLNSVSDGKVGVWNSSSRWRQAKRRGQSGEDRHRKRYERKKRRGQASQALRTQEAERTCIASATNVREDRRCGGVPILVPARSKLEHSPSG